MHGLIIIGGDMDRIALVIGNSDYIYVEKLKNPKNDANDISNILETLGFNVKKYLNLTITEMEDAKRNFLIELRHYSTGLFFYAGHAMQIEGNNYLVPIDCQITDKETTIFSCLNVNTYLDGIAKHEGKTNICILDACRDNPFVRTGRGITSGFAQFSSQPNGTIIAFSTSSENTASDGNGNNGLYTSVLKESLLIPNLKIEEMFKTTRIKVMALSNNKQVPWEHSCLMGDFYFSVKEKVIPEVKDIDDLSYMIGKCRAILLVISDNVEKINFNLEKLSLSNTQNNEVDFDYGSMIDIKMHLMINTTIIRNSTEIKEYTDSIIEKLCELVQAIIFKVIKMHHVSISDVFLGVSEDVVKLFKLQFIGYNQKLESVFKDERGLPYRYCFYCHRYSPYAGNMCKSCDFKDCD